MNLLLLFSSLLLLSFSALAGQSKGNGGQGIRLHGKIYSFDLFESGLHKSPYFNPKIETDGDYLSRVQAVLPKELPSSLVAKKLSELKAITKINSLLLLKILESLKWWVVDSSLRDTEDGNQTPINNSKLDMVQLAVRLGDVVRLDREALKNMESENRSALVLHEVIYTWFSSVPVDDSSRSAYTRNVVAYLFSKEMGDLKIRDWGNSFPKYDAPPGLRTYEDDWVHYWEVDNKIRMTPSYTLEGRNLQSGGHINITGLVVISPDTKFEESQIEIACNNPKHNAYPFAPIQSIFGAYNYSTIEIGKDHISAEDKTVEEGSFDFTSPTYCRESILKKWSGLTELFAKLKK